jgi:hypothetical protein
MSENLPILWEDKINSPELKAYLKQFGKNGYMTAEEVNQLRDAVNEMSLIQKSTFIGVAEPTDVPTGTGRGYWEVITPGTYTKFGGKVLGFDERGLIARDTAGVFTMSKVAYSFRSYVKNDDLNKMLKATISFNEKEFTGRKLNSGTGIIESTGSGNISEYISINALFKYGVSNLGNSNATHAGVVFYDIDKLEIVSSIIVVSSTPILDTGVLITPSNAVFIRIAYAPTRVVGVPILYSISAQQLGNDIKKLDLRIDQNKINNERLLKANIVFNEKAISGSKLSSTTGILESTGFGFISEYISINALFKYGVSNLGYSQVSHAGVVFYDIDKLEIVSSIIAVRSIPIVDTDILITPSNAVFMRITYDPTRITGIPILYSISAQQLGNDIKKLNFKIDQNKINNESLLKANIVFNEKAISGSKLSSTTGILESTGFGFISEYILINILFKYGVSNLGYSQASHAGVVFYDIDKSIILSSIIAVRSTPVLETDILITPSNAVFMRITYDPSRITGIPILYSISTQQLANDIKKLNFKIDNISNAGLPIQFWGDSIGSQIASQAATLSPIDGRIVNNKCVGGETTLDTLAKMNIFPYSVSPFTIPAESINVIINLTSSFGEKNNFNLTNGEIQSTLGSTSINPWDNLKCEIQGVSGTIYFKRGGDNNNHYFKRDIAGVSVTISRSTRVVIKGLNKKIIPVVFMGTNGGWDKDWGVPEYIDATFEDADNLVNYYKEIVRFLEPASNNFLFLGYYKTAFSDQKNETDYKLFWDYFNSKMTEAFGNNFLNVKEYLRSYGWKDAGYQLGTRRGSNSTYTLLQEDIDLDIENISRGKIPHCVVGATFATHLTAKVSACVANQVVKRLYEMSLVSTMPQINISEISDFGIIEFEN